MKFRFSVSTLLTTVLLIASAAAFWVKSDAWVNTFHVTEAAKYEIGELRVSPDGRLLLYAAFDTQHDRVEWVLWDCVARNSQRFEANSRVPIPLPASMLQPPVCTIPWRAEGESSRGIAYYDLRTNASEHFPSERTGTSFDRALKQVLVTSRTAVPRLIQLNRGTDERLPFLKPLKVVTDFVHADSLQRMVCDRKLFDTKSGQSITTLQGKEGGVSLSQTQRFVLSRTDNSIFLYDTRTGDLLREFALAANDAAFSADDKYLAILSRNLLRVYSTEETFPMLWSRPVADGRIDSFSRNAHLYLRSDELPPALVKGITIKSVCCIDWQSGKTLVEHRNLGGMFEFGHPTFENGVYRVPYHETAFHGSLTLNATERLANFEPFTYSKDALDGHTRFVTYDDWMKFHNSYITDAHGEILFSFPENVRFDKAGFSIDMQCFASQNNNRISVWQRRRNEQLWGVTQLPEFWVFVLFAGIWLFNLRRAFITRSARYPQLSPTGAVSGSASAN